MGKKSSKTTTQTVYGNTTTTNPYATSQTTNNGTVSAFKSGTAFDTINNYVNNNMKGWLEQYLNPTLDSVTNQAKLNAYLNTLNNASAKALENNIVNPLSKRNMIRSSQATNLYNNLAQNNANQIAEYANELISNSQKDTASMIANMMLWYLNGYNVINDTQRQSLSTSQGNSTKTQNAASTNYDMSQMLQIATQMAMLAAQSDDRGV